MNDRDRMVTVKNAVANVAAVCLVTFGAAVAFAATAAADPPPEPLPLPGEPAPPPPPGPVVPVVGAPLGPAGLNVLAQNGLPPNDVPGALGAPQVVGLDQATVLGQLPAPSAPGANPGTPPNLNPFNNGYGLGQNLKPSAPGQGEQFDVAPGEEQSDVSRREWFGRYIDMYRAGMLKGGLLGQMPQEQLGEPLPGTAPLPGTNVPPGLGQFLPDPADAPPPPAPGAPPLVPPPPAG
jgi:hypothetical protein